MDVNQIFCDAAKVIRKRGWYQGDLCKDDPDNSPVCMLGAIYVTLYGTPKPKIVADLSDTFSQIREEFIRRVAPTTRQSKLVDRGMSGWNDVPSRTKEEVLEALEREC